MPEMFATLVARELASARASHPPQNSLHESYAVILEEFEEFWQEVCKKKSQRDKHKTLMELVQLAAMAQRAAEDNGLL